ncbi:histamine H2 receptor-like [Antedon mediterranea]|uniref:histamine H2 receptor-like n=1 Tax=Antedon mediterranea TaxID=105859 RepID=UPI003AF6DF9B
MNYSNNTEPFNFAIPMATQLQDIIYLVLYPISGVVAVLGNVFVCWVFIRNKLLHTPTNMMLLNLAVIDEVTGHLLIIMSVFYNTGDFVKFGKGFQVAVTFVFMSLLNLFVIGVDRLLTLTYPLKYMKISDKTKCIVFIASVWISGMFASYIVFYSGSSVVIIDCGVYVTTVSSMSVDIVIGVSIVFTIGIHAKVYFIASNQARRISESQVQGRKKHNINVKAIKTTLFVLGAFVVCYIPSLVYRYSSYTCSPLGGKHTADVFAVVFYISMSGSTVNPIIYSLRKKEFKKQILNIFNRCGLCRKHQASAEMSMSMSVTRTAIRED